MNRAESAAIQVLHVDDDREVAELTADLLEREREGIAVSTETDPTTALERIETEHFDCVVSDYKMPELNGVELLGAVRETDDSLPFILFTGNGSESVASEAIAAGVSDYVQKKGGSGQYSLLAVRISNAVTKHRAETVLSGIPQGQTALFQLLVESVRDYAIFMLDTDGYVISWNTGAQRIKGYREDDILGRHFSVFYPDEEVKQGVPMRNLETAAAEDRVEDEGWRIRKDGSRFYANVTISAVRDSAGQLRGFAKVTRDMTADNRHREIERQRDRLEEFLGVLTHDLRNPLQVARAHLELLETDTGEEKRRETIGEALVRMDAIIDDLLTLARHGETVSSIEPIDLAAIAEDAWSTSKDPNDGTDADLAIETELAFDADRGRLRELLENLFVNAIEHGRDDVTVEIGDLSDGTGFYVEDDGPGIPADEREQAFEAGYSTADDGTGFGLSIVKQIAEAHGWSVRATAGNDGGARFEITGVETDR